MEMAVAREISYRNRPLPSRSRRRRIRKIKLSSWLETVAQFPVAEQSVDANNGDDDAGLQRTFSSSNVAD
jgi:hypothetical protein